MHTPVRTVGVEEEFLLADPGTGLVRAAAQEVTWKVNEELGRPAQRELTQEQVEVGTIPTTDTAELHAELRRLRKACAQAAASSGVALVALATSPLAAAPTTTSDDRYLTMTAEFGQVGREQLTCGCHVHVGIDSREQGIAALNRIRPWLHCLTAISTNSPYWGGTDTGYQSWRTVMWQRWPSAGPTGRFDSVEAYEQLAEDMVRTGVLFDRKMLYYDVRLSDHQATLEIRVPDVCGSVDDAVLVAALVRGLVTTAVRHSADGVPPLPVRTELLRVAQWRAARSGVHDDLVDLAERRPVPAANLLDRLADHVAPALRQAGDTDLVRSGLDRVLRDGTGADRQRAVYAKHHDLAEVVRDAIRRTVT